MTPIHGVNAGSARPLTSLERVIGPPAARKSGEDANGRPEKPAVDEYVPGEKPEPSGRYWLGKDESGQPKVHFDGSGPSPDSAPEPEKPEQDSEAQGAKPGSKKSERCVGNTDKVDREIEKLKRKQKELEQRISTESDEARIRELEKQLTQVERELSEKDNDAYRKQHSTFTQLS